MASASSGEPGDRQSLSTYRSLGATLAGMIIVYHADKKLDFPTDGVWYVQILKTVVGLILALAVKEGLRTPLEMILPVYPARAVRYCLVVITAGILWPMSFQYLSKLGVKK